MREVTTIHPQREHNGKQKAGSSTRRTRFVLNDTRFRDIGNVPGVRLTFKLAPERVTRAQTSCTWMIEPLSRSASGRCNRPDGPRLSVSLAWQEGIRRTVHRLTYASKACHVRPFLPRTDAKLRLRQRPMPQYRHPHPHQKGPLWSGSFTAG